MEHQLKAIGATYDWDYEVVTCDPNYYKWTQWLFLQMYKNGLAYRKEAPVNWCPSCQTVLANEQVEDGVCERCGSTVVRKNLTQWFFKITQYAEELLNDIDGLDWPEKTKLMQKHWIGKSVAERLSSTWWTAIKKSPVFTDARRYVIRRQLRGNRPRKSLVDDLPCPNTGRLSKNIRPTAVK